MMAFNLSFLFSLPPHLSSNTVRVLKDGLGKPQVTPANKQLAQENKCVCHAFSSRLKKPQRFALSLSLSLSPFLTHTHTHTHKHTHTHTTVVSTYIGEKR